MNKADFRPTLKTGFLSLVERINSQGFRVGVVGGYIRDYKLGKVFSDFHDYDCELRPINPSTDLLKEFKELKSNISKHFSTRELPFEILRITGEDFEAEISLPRVETFLTEFHHSNFEASFIADLDYKLGFKRRDFTLNAMMIELYDGEITFIDPLGGESDLADKKLKPCSQDSFAQDPVRFLRAIRFKTLLSNKGSQFSLDPAIIESFLKVELSDFTLHYLQTEMFKSNSPLLFLTSLFEMVNQERIDLADELLKEFDHLWNLHKKNNFFSNALFLPKSFSEVFSSHLSLSKKNVLNSMPWVLKEDIASSKWIGQFEFLLRAGKKLVDFYYKWGFIDLTFDQIEEINQVKVDLTKIPNMNKKTFKYTEQTRIYFENKKS